MKVMVNGQQRELHCFYPQDRMDITEDIIFDSGEKFDYDSEAEMPIMTAEQFDWWAEYLEQAEKDNGEILRLKDIYGAEKVEEIISRHDWYFTSDYNEHHQRYLELFETIKDELEDDGQ